MVKIAKDTPPELLEMIAMVDVSKLTDKRITDGAKELWELAVKFSIPRRNKEKKIQTAEINLPAKAQPICNLTAIFDFGKVSKFKRAAAMPFIRKWIADNLPLKKGKL